jgi:hypothetical protein
VPPETDRHGFCCFGCGLFAVSVAGEVKNVDVDLDNQYIAISALRTLTAPFTAGGVKNCLINEVQTSLMSTANLEPWFIDSLTPCIIVWRARMF